MVSWSIMIVEYAENGFVKKFLESFKLMQLESVKPKLTTIDSIPLHLKKWAISNT